MAQYLNAEGTSIEEISLTPENLVEMIGIIEDGTISSKIAKKVFLHLAKEGGSMTRVAEKTGLERTHLYRKLKQLGVDLSRGRRSAVVS